jgi:Ricin-type beta-trefoil lectin domain-like
MHRTFRTLAITALMAAALPLGLLGSATAASAASAPQKTAKAMGLAVTPDIPSAGGFNIYNANASGKCIGIADGLAGDWNCTSNPDQTWHWGAVNASGWQQLINGNGLCLGVQGGGDAQGTRIVAFTCLGTGHPDQYWTVGDDGYGGNNILNYEAYSDPNTSVSLIGVGGGSTANGAPVVLWYYDGTANQFWY